MSIGFKVSSSEVYRFCNEAEKSIAKFIVFELRVLAWLNMIKSKSFYIFRFTYIFCIFLYYIML